MTLIHPDANRLSTTIESQTGHRIPPRACYETLVLASEADVMQHPARVARAHRVPSYWGYLLGVPQLQMLSVWEILVREDTEENPLYCSVDPLAGETLRAIRGYGITVGVISNSAGTVAEDLRRADLSDLVDFVIDSTAVGVEKPNVGIYHRALDIAHVDAQDAWHVGDGLVKDVSAALRAGYSQAILFDPLKVRNMLRGLPVVNTLSQVLGYVSRDRASQ